MPESDDDLVEHPERKDLPPHIREQLRRSDKMQAEIDAANQRATAAERRNLLSDAGFATHPSKALLENFLATSSDELTVEKIQEIAKANGLTPLAAGAGGASSEGGTSGEPVAGESGPSAADLEAARRANGATAGTAPAGVIPFEDAIAEAAKKGKAAVLEVLANAPEGAGIVLADNVVG